MGLPAAKHLDVVLGIDVHIVLIPSPAGPIPTPIPHPYVGMLMDPMDYVPKLGTAIRVNGVPRAVAGTSGVAMVPHIPMGGPFMKPPTNESEMFMGSMSVNADGDPMSFAPLPVLSCQDIGMPAPARLKKKSVAKSLMLPTGIVMPIPTGPMVMVGGAPTIIMPGLDALIAPLGKALARARKALAKRSKKFARKMKDLSRKLLKLADKALDKLKLKKNSLIRNKVHRGICAVTGHPVDIATGKLFTDFVDLEFAGPLPFKLERVWYSTSTYKGPLGHGWHHNLDMALAVDEKVIAIRLADGRAALFPPLKTSESYFDPAARHTLRRDGYGYALSDAAGLSYRFAEQRGRAVQPLASIQDRNGFALQFGYDKDGRLEQLKDSAGCLWTLRYDAYERIHQLEGPHPSEADKRLVYLEYAYDGRGNLAEVTDVLRQLQRFSYERSLLVKETNRNGLSFYFAWDGKEETARCVRTWGDGGIYDHKLVYDGRKTTVETSLGYKTTYLHDGAMVHKVLDAYGNISLTEYTAGHRVSAEINELGQRTSYKYDARGNLIESMGPDGAKLSLAYGPQDLPVHALDALGGEWTFERDARGRLVERKDPLGRVTRFHYHAQWLVGLTDPAGGYTGIGYDPVGNLDAIATPDNTTTRYSHDLLGRVVSITDPKGNVQRRELDLLGRPIVVHEPDGNVRRLYYDREGNVVHAQDQQHDVRFGYKGMNRLASRSEASTTVQFEYDTEEQLTAIVNEHGRVYSFKLGPTGEVDEEHGFDGLMRRYRRDKLGRVQRVDRPAGRSSEYKYDPAGRVTRVMHSDGSVESYAYRPDGELTHASNSELALVFERDPLGRILKEKQGEHWVASRYDLFGLRSELSSSLGASVSITRNVMGDVTRVADKSGFAAQFERDQLGLELSRSLPGGVKSRWQRDKLGRPVQHTVSAGDQTLRAVGYKWEVNDRLRMVIDAVEGPTEYRHDALGNLAWGRYADGKGEMRMPDAVGNLFKREERNDRAYGPAGQLLAQSTLHGEIHYSYDAEGNLVEKREPGGRVWRYQWNGSGMQERAAPRRHGGHVRLRRARSARAQDVSGPEHQVAVGRQRAAARVGGGQARAFGGAGGFVPVERGPCHQKA